MDVSFRDEKRFVWAQFNGTWTLDELPGLLAVIQKECGTRGCPLLLIDLRALKNNEISTFERFKIGLGAASLAGGVQRMATLARPDQIDPQRFGETVARNRGLNTRIFGEQEKALAWLLQPEGKEDLPR
ncbi:MAG TPA: hypothetical protein VNM14_02815 [Planctomycetota bacterium]|jgi:hypothetical protein|nr:hypothetical protein [Planctomycetota bacterium]